jgi:hypothetical protein
MGLYSVRLVIIREIPCIVLYNIKDKDTTNIVSLQMNVGFKKYLRNSQLYGFNKSSRYLKNVKRKIDKLSQYRVLL